MFLSILGFKKVPLSFATFNCSYSGFHTLVQNLVHLNKPINSGIGTYKVKGIDRNSTIHFIL